MGEPPGGSPPFWMWVFVFFGPCVTETWCLQIYTDWANHYLAKSGHKRLIKDLQTDVTDGVLLAEIIQVVGKDAHIPISLNNLRFVATFVQISNNFLFL